MHAPPRKRGTQSSPGAFAASVLLLSGAPGLAQPAITGIPAFGNALRVSDNGSVVTGSTGLRTKRWTSPGGAHDIGLGSSFNSVQPAGISCVGRVIVGYGDATGGAGPRGYRWVDGVGFATLAPTIGTTSSYGYAVNYDGSVCVGLCRSTVGDDIAVRWDASRGFRPFNRTMASHNSLKLPSWRGRPARPRRS